MMRCSKQVGSESSVRMVPDDDGRGCRSSTRFCRRSASCRARRYVEEIKFEDRCTVDGGRGVVLVGRVGRAYQ